MIDIIIRDQASPELTELQSVLEPGKIMKVLGKTAEVNLRQHFEDRGREPNKQGWRSNNFWARIRSATALAEVSDDEATVAIADPAINQKVYGGTITAKRARMLALPASAEAYAAGSPREGGGPVLTFAFSYDTLRGVWRPALVAKYNYQRKIKKGKRAGELTKANAVKSTEGIGKVWYWLVASVTQEADQKALPDNAVMDQKINDAITELLQRVRERRAA
jgi:hypothetical protein